jgi:hypothetical protein
MNIGKLPTLKIVRGSQKLVSYRFDYTDVDDMIYNLDLSLYDDIRIDVRRSENPYGPVIFQMALNDGLSITDYPETTDKSVLNIHFESKKTDNFEADGDYYYDIFVITGENGVHIAKGKIRVEFNKTEMP